VSWEVVNQVAPLQMPSPTTKFVAMVIANACPHETAPIFLSTRTICQTTQLSESSVRRHIDALVECGVLWVIEERVGQTTVYQFNPNVMSYPWKVDPCQGDTPSIVQGVHTKLEYKIAGSEDTPVILTPLAEVHPSPSTATGEGVQVDTPPLSDVQPPPVTVTPKIEVKEKGKKEERKGNGPPARPPDPPEMLFELLQRVPAVAGCPPQTRDAQIATLGDRMRLIEAKLGVIDWDDAGLWIVEQCLSDKRWAGTLTVSAGEILSKMQSALERFFLRDKAESADPEDAQTKLDHPELWSAVEILFTSWRGRGIGFNKGILMREYVRTLHRFGVTSALVFRFADAAGNDIKWALPAHDLATFILIRCREKQLPVVMDDGAADELKQRCIEEFGKEDVPMAEARAHFRKRFGLDEESAA
jgi:hypothetical protein